MCVRVRESVCASERESVRERESVCVLERGCARESVYVRKRVCASLDLIYIPIKFHEEKTK